jgi:DNA mismatch repair ATPase MutS
LLDLVGELDLLFASAQLLREGFTVPEVIVDGKTLEDNAARHDDDEWRIEGEGIWHPFLERAVTNPLTLARDVNVLFLTGPNMAGKTTYIRSVAICLYLAQCALPVPAARFAFHPVAAFFTALSDDDDLRRGISSFKADLIRVRKILEHALRGDRTLAIFDELFRGTNITDSAECLETFIQGALRRTSSGFIISSHLVEVAERFTESTGLRPFHFAAEWNGRGASFDYTLRPGISTQRLGRLLFRQEGLDELLV